MSYNGSGTFTINTTGQPVVAGTIISSTAFNSLTSDLATGLTTAITKDGQTTTTARITFAQGFTSSLTTDSSSITTGSIITAGGVGIAKNLYVGVNANIAGTLDVTGTTTLTNPVINNIKLGYTTTATAAGTTTLTVASNYQQFFTGTTTQTIVLPVTSTLALGISYLIENNSTGLLTVQSSGLNTITTISSGVTASFTCILITGTTAASWDYKQVGFANGITYDGYKNRLINPAMAVDQRNAGAAQTFTAGAALAYSVDRWYGYCTGANVTGQQIAGTSASSQYRYQFTGAASVTAIGFAQRIEAKNCYDLANATVTLSAFISNSLLTSVTCTAYYANSEDTFGTLATPTRTLIDTVTFTVSATRTKYTTTITLPSAATTGIEIVFTVGAQTSGTWIIDSVQLEKNNIPTSFDYRSYGTELALCQRYYFSQGGSTAYEMIGTGACITTGSAVVVVPFEVQMRTTPSFDTSGSFFIKNATANTNVSVTSFSLDTVGKQTASINANCGTVVAGDGTFLFAANDTTARVKWYAEL
jgi:hypothetical protein